MTVAHATQRIRRDLSTLSDQEIRQILDFALAAGVKLFDRQLAMRNPDDGFDLAYEIHQQEKRLLVLLQALKQNNLAPVDNSGSQILAEAGIDFDIGSAEYRIFLRQRLAMEIQRTQIETRRLQGDYSDILPMQGPPQDPTGPFPTGPVLGPSAAPSPIQGRTLGLLEAFKEFKTEWLRANRRLKTLDQYKQSLMLFIDAFGELRCCDLTLDHGVDFKKILLQVPADYRQAKKLKSLRIREIVKQRLIEEGRPPLSLKTINRHLGALCTFGKWMMKDRYIVLQANPFGGLFLPNPSDPRAEREMHSREDLLKLFLSPVWTGCNSKGRRSEPGPFIFKDAKFFVPLLGLYCGLRLEEACQLSRADVRLEAGIWIIDVLPDRTDKKKPNRKLGKRLKSKSAARKIPVHPILVETGFIEFVCKGSSQNLFDDLSRANKYGSAGGSFTQWFGRYRRAIGCRERFKDFHSLRHNFVTAAMNAGVHPAIVEALDGHKQVGQTRGRYHKGYTLEILNEAVCKVHFEIETELLAAIANRNDEVI
jgi:integrase